MKSSKIRAIISALIFCSATAFAQSPATSPSSTTTGNDMAGMSMSGDKDKDFATMMRMHHQKALDMAKKELADGKSPEMKAMARNIIDSQTKEIAEFDKWLAAHK